MNRKRPYIFDSEFANDNENDMFSPHSEPHPFRLYKKDDNLKKAKKEIIDEQNKDI